MSALQASKRIDAGIKRGPKAQRRPGPGKLRRSPETGLPEGIPADLDPKRVLDLYLQNPTTSGIAQTLGLRRSSLTLWLRKTCPEDWKNVQIAKALMRKEDADEGLETADNALDLARAREMLRSGQWDLERLDASSYGPKQEVQHTVVAPTLQITVVSAQHAAVLPAESLPATIDHATQAIDK